MRSKQSYRLLVSVFCLSTFCLPLMAQTYQVTISTQDCSRQQVLEATQGMPITIVAEPQPGATFLGWSNGAMANPYSLTITSDTALAPLFSTTAPANKYQLTLYADQCDAPTILDVAQGNTVTLIAEPQNGYLFSKWEDGNTANPRTVTVIADATYRAIFAVNPATSGGSSTSLPTHTITIQSDRCTVPKTLQVLEGKHITMTATADNCGTFLRWSDGNTDNPRTVEVTADATYTAEFTKQQYTITAMPDDAAHGVITITIE